MKKEIFIGCDIGTSGTKAVATDINGNILAQSAVTYGIIQSHNNWVEQDPDVWLDAAVQTIRDAAGQIPSATDIKAICISALYGGTGVMCDKDMNSLRPALIWMDRRAEEESREITDTIGAEKILQISGNGIDSYFGYTKLLWVKKHEPEIWKKIRHIIPIHSYIICKMTGNLTVDYCSAGNVGGIYDYNTHSWSEEMCQKLDISYDTLPRDFHSPEDIIGTLNHEYQEKLRINAPVPLCTGTVDCIASMLSAGIIQIGDNAAVLGTSLNWGYVHNKKPTDSNLVSMPYCYMPEQYSYTYGGASTAGALPRWFVSNFMGNDDDTTYAKLEEMIQAQNIGPGSDGLIALPYFMGERTPIWDENATGTLFGLTLSHTKAHIYRAILESVAYSLLHIMESMKKSDITIDKIVLVGGGAKSALWRQIFADVTGLPILTPTQKIEAPLGDAFMAALGSGFIKNYTEVKNWVEMDAPIEPNKNHHEQYKKYYALYKELYINLKETMTKRAELLK